MFTKKKEEQNTVKLSEQGHSTLAAIKGALGQGLAALFGNLSPATFKRIEVNDEAVQTLTTPLGGSITSTYSSHIAIDAAPEVAQAITQAQEETERARIAAENAMNEAREEVEG